MNPAPALVIADANAETAIVNNIITGEVRFYGATSSILPKTFKSIVKTGKLLSAKSQGRAARIEGNSLTQVVVDEAGNWPIRSLPGTRGASMHCSAGTP